jgi:hypothetical protein
MIKTEVRPLAGFEEDYARYIERKAKVEEEVKAEFARVLAERTSKLDRLIAETSEIVEVEVPDEVHADEQPVEQQLDEQMGE